MPFNLSVWGERQRMFQFTLVCIVSSRPAYLDYRVRFHLKIKILKKNKGLKKLEIMALSVKYLSCKHEDLNLIPRTYIFKIQV